MSREIAADIDPPAASPVYRLWSRVLQMGVRDAMAESLDLEEHYPSARRWLFDDTSSNCGSVLWIVQQLNIRNLREIRLFVSTANVDDFKALRRALF